VDFVILLVKEQFTERTVELQALPGAGIDSIHNLLLFFFSKIYTRLKKIIGFRKGKPILALQKSHTRRKSVQDTVEKRNSVHVIVKTEI